VDIVLHSYAILFSVLVIIIEADWRYVVSRFRLMDTWIWRGLFYALIGFLTLDNESVDIMALKTTPIIVVGFMQIFFGVLYCCMGLLCLKNVEDERWENYDNKKRYVEIEHV